MKKLLLAMILVSQSGCSVAALFFPPIKVWIAEAEGKAELAHAEFSKQVQIQDAHGKQESAKMLAQAEIERAKGVSVANQIIGESLKSNEAYLRYLWIQGLNSGSHETVYIPTEAGLPILEAGRRAGVKQ